MPDPDPKDVVVQEAVLSAEVAGYELNASELFILGKAQEQIQNQDVNHEAINLWKSIYSNATKDGYIKDTGATDAWVMRSDLLESLKTVFGSNLNENQIKDIKNTFDDMGIDEAVPHTQLGDVSKEVYDIVNSRFYGTLRGLDGQGGTQQDALTGTLLSIDDHKHANARRGQAISGLNLESGFWGGGSKANLDTKALATALSIKLEREGRIETNITKTPSANELPKEQKAAPSSGLFMPVMPETVEISLPEDDNVTAPSVLMPPAQTTTATASTDNQPNTQNAAPGTQSSQVAQNTATGSAVSTQRVGTATPAYNVRHLQMNLNFLGYTDADGMSLKVDNDPGPKTRQALQQFVETNPDLNLDGAPPEVVAEAIKEIVREQQKLYLEKVGSKALGKYGADGVAGNLTRSARIVYDVKLEEEAFAQKREATHVPDKLASLQTPTVKSVTEKTQEFRINAGDKGVLPESDGKQSILEAPPYSVEPARPNQS